MNRKFALSSLLLSIVATTTHAGVKVTSIDLETKGANGFVSIALEGRSSEMPDINVRGNTIELSITGADPFNAITKHIRGAHLSANVLNGKAIVKAQLPYEIDAQSVDLSWKNANIELIFPRGKAVAAKAMAIEAAAAPAVAATKNITNAPVKTIKPAVTPKVTVADMAKKPSTITKEALNEDYLNKLMNDTTAKKNAEEKTEVVAKTEVAKAVTNKDEVNLKQAAPAQVNTQATTKPQEDKFSFAGYAVKFTVFLAMVLGLFYGVVQLLKKGVFNRGKLGFLNNHQMIEVLSTTYVSPKKSLMIVKAHKQLFLVANSENGLQFLSEMKDTSGIIKEGEKAITGANFDMKLAFEEAQETTEAATPKFKIKEDITKSTPVTEDKGIAKLAVAKDIVKFSDELKKKAKKLKPIEFN